MGLLESIRRWIDGEQGEDLLEAADEHSKPRRIWEEFLVKIAREVEAVMQREMFTPPGGLTYIPREYVVYLSAEDDKDWQGDKRRGLEQGLFHVLSERARELAGSTPLAAKSFAVELRVDGTLEKGSFACRLFGMKPRAATRKSTRASALPVTGAQGQRRHNLPARRRLKLILTTRFASAPMAAGATSSRARKMNRTH